MWLAGRVLIGVACAACVLGLLAALAGAFLITYWLLDPAQLVTMVSDKASCQSARTNDLWTLFIAHPRG